jgi:hypothetical protein
VVQNSNSNESASRNGSQLLNDEARDKAEAAPDAQDKNIEENQADE